MPGTDLLLDSHALLWWMAGSPELSATARSLIEDPASTVRISAAVVWEVGVKARLGRLHGVEDYLAEPERWHREWRFAPLPMDQDDARVAAALVWDHRDPFDRMLVAQARRHRLALVTCDPAITAYHPGCRW